MIVIKDIVEIVIIKDIVEIVVQSHRCTKRWINFDCEGNEVEA